MIMHFRGKNTRDIETQSETVISSTSFVNLEPLKKHGPSLLNISQQQEIANFENTLEHRK